MWTEPRIYAYLTIVGFLGVALWLVLWLRYGLRRATLAATLVIIFSGASGFFFIVRSNLSTQTQTSGQSWPGVIAVGALEGFFTLVVPFSCFGLAFCAAAIGAFLALEARRSSRSDSMVNDGDCNPHHDTPIEHGA
jgi:hypothetical protein